jgi:hypothetical protein
MEWYLSFFKNAPAGVIAVGELSHDYLFSRLAAERIARDLPGVKLLTCLRNPIERTLSNYLQMLRNRETTYSFEEALQDIPKLIDHSMYHKYLSEYLKLFNPEDLKILWFDDLKADSESFAKDVFQFLGLSFLYNIDYKKKVLTANRPRSFLFAKMAKFGANAVRNWGLPNLVGTVKRSVFTKILYKPYRPEERPKMNPAVREELRKIFKPEIKKLEDLLHEDLSHWLSVKDDRDFYRKALSPIHSSRSV